MSSFSTRLPAVIRNASWIWPESHHWDLHNCYALFRKTFELTELPRRAPLLITADQSYQLYINGRYICRGPARGYQESWPYDEVDVSAALLKGRNVIAVRAHNPGFSNFQYVSRGYAGLLAAAKWGRTEIVTDKTWRCRRQRGVLIGTAPVCLQLFCQEHIDLRVEDANWMDTDFDDRHWQAVADARPWNAMPWSGLQARGLPMLEETIVEPRVYLGMAAGACAKDFRMTRDAARTRHAEGLAHLETAPRSLEPLHVPPTGQGRFRSYLLDFGKTVVGSVILKIEGASGGEIVDTLHAETIDQETNTPDYEPDKISRMAFSHRLICREGRNRHAFYHVFGFRYMVLTVRDSSSELTIRSSVRTALYPLEHKGRFESSADNLNRIWEACVWTQRVCSLDAYVDTPWREQAQWWGDARVQAWNTFYLSGDPRLFRRGIAQIAAQTTPNGLTYGHAPTMAHSCILPDFTLIWFLTLWDFYWQTGSTEPFRTHRTTVEAALDYFEGQLHPKHDLLPYDKRYWLFLDWTEIFKDGFPSVYSLWFLQALQKLRALHDLSRLSYPESNAKNDIRFARRLLALERRVTSGLKKLVGKTRNANGLVCDGLTWKGTRVLSSSIHTQTLALMVNILSDPAHERALIDNVLRPHVRGETKSETPSQPSAYWITYVFTELISRGHGDEVVECIRRRWLEMADYGTTWETFSPEAGSESHSHAWSAHPLYHLMQTVGGIRQTAAAWKEIEYRPVFYGDYNHTAVPTPQGSIIARWSRKEGAVDVMLKLPAGIRAKVILPGQQTRTIRHSLSVRLTSL